MWAWRWPHLKWISEELRNGRWVELNIDAAVVEAYIDVREVLERPGTAASRKADLDAVLRHHAETLSKLDTPPEV